jgi:lipid II:glycine glycyltransferase (peptidoglycan interpeptide bridge formation enzyme)
MTQQEITTSLSSEATDEELASWDALVQAIPVSDVTQLSSWAKLRQRVGYQPLYLFTHENRDLVGGTQILLRRLPLLGTVGYCSYGPLIGRTDRRPDVGSALSSAMRQVGRGLAMLFVQPPEHAEDVAGCLLARGFRPSDADIAPAATLRVDLTASVEQLRGNLSRRLRGWSHQWAKRGVTVRKGDEGDLTVLAKLIACSAEHQGYRSFSENYLRTLHDELASQGNAVCFIAEVSGKAVAGDLLTGCGQTLKRRLVGLDRSNEAVRLNASGAVVWESILWAKSQGYRYFDFSGAMPVSARMLEVDGATDPEMLDGPDRFKTRFGARLYRYPQAVELISSSLLRSTYDFSRRTAAGRRLQGLGKRLMRGAG